MSMAGIILLPFSAAVSRRGVLGGAAASSLAAQHATPAAHATAAQRRVVYVAGATGRTGSRVVEELLRNRDQFGVVAGARTEASAARLPAGVVRLVADLSGEVRGAEAELASELRTRQVTDVVCTLGFAPTYLPEQDRKLAEAVDYLGTLRLLTACEAAALPGRFVLVSSLGVDAATDSARVLLATCYLLLRAQAATLRAQAATLRAQAATLRAQAATSRAQARLLDASLGGVLRQKRRAEAAVRGSSLDWTIVRPGAHRSEAP